MKRIMFIAVASVAILAIAPVSGLASSSKRLRDRTTARQQALRHPKSTIGSAASPTTRRAQPARSTRSTHTLVIELTDNTLVSVRSPRRPRSMRGAGQSDMGDMGDAIHRDGDPSGGGDNSSSGVEGMIGVRSSGDRAGRPASRPRHRHPCTWSDSALDILRQGGPRWTAIKATAFELSMHHGG